MFSIEMLPAERGDCLWLTYGADDDLHHVVIDAGPSQTQTTVVPELRRRIKALGGKANCVELLVITHVDRDHIQGIVQLLAPATSNRFFREIWFNGFHHLGALGAVEGEQLTAELNRDKRRWNKSFDHHAVVVPPDGPLPVVTLPGGLKITLLSPSPAKLEKMIPRWETEVRRAGLVPGEGAPLPRKLVEDGILGVPSLDDLAASKFVSDTEPPNGSSIAFLAEFEGKKALLGADAFMKEVIGSLKRLGPGPLELDAVKLPHHGSRKNLNVEFVSMVRCRNWLFSSNGAQFNHPNPETIARIVCNQPAKPTLHFNYVSEFTAPWKTHPEKNRYKAVYPKKVGGVQQEGLVVTL